MCQNFRIMSGPRFCQRVQLCIALRETYMLNKWLIIKYRRNLHHWDVFSIGNVMRGRNSTSYWFIKWVLFKISQVIWVNPGIKWVRGHDTNHMHIHFAILHDLCDECIVHIHMCVRTCVHTPVYLIVSHLSWRMKTAEDC